LRILTLLVAVCFLSSAIFQVVPAHAATVQQCSAPASSQCTLTFNLNNGDKVSGSISITGGSSNDVNFYVTNPSGAKIYDAGRVTDGTSFTFSADSSGAYILHFDNSFSLLSGKQVTVSYDVSSGGIPEFPPQILFATVLALFVVASYLIVRRRVTNASS
jgi:emp24/gp25L/p24 family/GOLD